MHGQESSEDELRAWTRVEDVIADFKAADKYVLSVPMWNFGIPYRLKQYFDVLVQPWRSARKRDPDRLVIGTHLVCGVSGPRDPYEVSRGR